MLEIGPTWKHASLWGGAKHDIYRGPWRLKAQPLLTGHRCTSIMKAWDRLIHDELPDTIRPRAPSGWISSFYGVRRLALPSLPWCPGTSSCFVCGGVENKWPPLAHLKRTPIIPPAVSAISHSEWFQRPVGKGPTWHHKSTSPYIHPDVWWIDQPTSCYSLTRGHSNRFFETARNGSSGSHLVA